MYLYLDIETIPTQSERVRKIISDKIKPPGTMKKPETIAEWRESAKQTIVDDEIAKTSLDGAYGQICCIGWAIDSAPATSVYGNDEQGLLRDFISQVQGVISDRRFIRPTIVGHNVLNFDIRFIWQRAIVLGVAMPTWFPRDPKPWGQDVFDTMTAFSGMRGTVSMVKLCDALGIEGKGDIDGSMVAGLWASGRCEEVAEYCRGDIDRTRQIHRRMQVAFGESQELKRDERPSPKQDEIVF